MSNERPRILFLCTGNSCRSQMAEGWALHLRSDVLAACSAGTRPQGLNPLAAQVMAEAGVDISTHTSKTIDAVDPDALDFVITVCGHAHETCPPFAGTARVIHHGFDDPPALAADARDEEEALGHYRRVRDEIRTYVETLPDALRGA
ncbi:MAG: arsenate reductase ArsC [Planctomycetota bacterium]|jgi:arsenate reductase